MEKILIIILCTSCSMTSSKPMMGPNNKNGYFIKCPPLAIDDCYLEATKLCPKGYSFLDKASSGAGMIMPVGSTFMMTSGPHTMLIECKE